MTGVALAKDVIGVQASYFYLSYAHSPPLAGPVQESARSVGPDVLQRPD